MFINFDIINFFLKESLSQLPTIETEKSGGKYNQLHKYRDIIIYIKKRKIPACTDPQIQKKHTQLLYKCDT